MLEHPSHLKAYCDCLRRWVKLDCADSECSTAMHPHRCRKAGRHQKCEELEHQMEFHWYRLSTKEREKARRFSIKLKEGD